MKKLRQVLVGIGVFLAPLALHMAYLTANSTCFFLSYQPDEPECLKNTKGFGLREK